MENYKTLIFAIAIICLVSGSYAVYLGNHDVSDAPTVQRSIIDDNGVENNTANHVESVIENNVITNNHEINNTNPSTNSFKKPKIPESFSTEFEYREFYKIYDSSNYGPKDNVTFKKLPGTNITVENYNYVDLYLQCPICGKYIALGNTTKKLPAEAICIDGCGAGSTNIIKEIALLYSYTYEEAYAHWLDSIKQEEINNQYNTNNNSTIEPSNTQSNSGINNQNTDTPTTEQTEDYSQYTFFNPSLHIC